MFLKPIKAIKDFKNKRVLVRCDFDVPLKKSKVKNQKSKVLIADDSRLQDNLATINYLLKHHAQVILMGHLGRPGGKIVKKLSLRPVADQLGKLLNKKIKLINITKEFDKSITNVFSTMSSNQLLMLENLRFRASEYVNDKVFAKQLANLADIYVNNAFADSHRAHASISAIQAYLPTYAGFDLIEEVAVLSKISQHPQHPLVLIIGGAKIATKLPVIQRYLKIADYILVGGAVANNFIKASGLQVGKSLIDKKYLMPAKKMLLLNHSVNSFNSWKIGLLKDKNQKIILPVDVITNKNIKRIDSITVQEAILDIGPATIQLYSSIIKTAKTIIWNGPLGKFEDKRYYGGTQAIAQQLLKSKAQIVIGGGDTDKIFKYKKLNKNLFISSGGGAMLEFLAGKHLPGLNN